MTNLCADVMARLEALGFSPQDADLPLITLIVQGVESEIKNECNTTKIPDGLKPVALDMACGEFLHVKKASGQLEGFNTDSMMVKQLQEGDTNVSFATEAYQSPEQRLDALIIQLKNGGRAQFVTYRRLKWT